MWRHVCGGLLVKYTESLLKEHFNNYCTVSKRHVGIDFLIISVCHASSVDADNSTCGGIRSIDFSVCARHPLITDVLNWWFHITPSLPHHYLYALGLCNKILVQLNRYLLPFDFDSVILTTDSGVSHWSSFLSPQNWAKSSNTIK